MQFFIIGLPLSKRLYSMSFQPGLFLAKLSEINFCFLFKTLMEINLVFLKIFSFEDFISIENKTKGGESDSDENEFIVFPYKIEFCLLQSLYTGCKF